MLVEQRREADRAWSALVGTARGGVLRRHLAVLVIAAVAGAGALGVSLALFPLFSLNRDDSVYVSMAEMLEHGNVTLSARQHRFFRPWASGVRDDRVVLKYTPVWPAVLAAADLVAGSPRAALMMTAAAVAALVYLLALQLFDDRRTAALAAAALALSPAFVIQAGTYLPYVFQLASSLAFACLLISGLRHRSRVRLALAGTALGVAAFARPFDAALFALPFAIPLLATSRRRLGAPAGLVGPLVLGAVPLVVLSLAYNAHVTGSPLRLPFSVTGPLDGIGFGRRGIFPHSTVSFTLGDGISGTLAILRWLPSWVFGGVVLVALAVYGFRHSRRSGPQRWAVGGVGVVWLLAYFPFWGTHAMTHRWPGVQALGPFYHLPMLVPLVVFAARGAMALVEARPWRRVPLAVGLVAVVLTAVSIPDKIALNRDATRRYRAAERTVAAARLDHAILFAPYRGDVGFLSETPFFRNRPDLRQPVLYAEDRDAENFGLLATERRDPYRLLLPFPGTSGPMAVVPLRMVRGTTVSVAVRLRNPSPRPVVTLDVTDGVTARRLVVDRSSGRDRTYEVPLTLVRPRTAEVRPGTVVPLGEGGRTGGVVAIGVSFDSGQGLRPADRWELRVPYRIVSERGGQRLELLVPGRGWHRGGPRASSVWVEGDVGQALELQVLAEGSPPR